MIKPIVLLILDGYGLNPSLDGNPIFNTPTPNLDKLMGMFPYASLHASGEEVGLSWGEMGNSEVGHLNLGTGKVVMQDLPRINQAIKKGLFFENKDLIEAIEHAKANGGNVHLIGLYSSGGVHSHYDHLFALLEMARRRKFNNIVMHLISDGRDTPPMVFLNDLKKVYQIIKQLGFGQIGTVMGRFYAMDRDNRKERTLKAFEALTSEEKAVDADIDAVVNNSYQQNVTDEFIAPIGFRNAKRIKANDSVIFFNFRSDRAKQLSEKIIEEIKPFFVSFTSYGYEPTPTVKVAFFAEKSQTPLASLLWQAELSQFHIAETEKYPHVTYFFNGGREEPFASEQRLLIPSPKVKTYDLKPEMSADQIVKNFIAKFQSIKPHFSVINLANADMVGHTGEYEPTRQAVQTVDFAAGKIAECVFSNGADLIVTADHGNAEQLINPQTGEKDKEHTTNPVPIILGFSERIKKNTNIDIDHKIALSATQPIGVLSDVTTTIIARLGLEKSKDMTGQSLEGLI